MLMIRLEESDCFASWVLGDKTGLPNADADIKGNYTILSSLRMVVAAVHSCKGLGYQQSTVYYY